MSSGGEFTVSKTVVGAVRDNAILKSDSDVKPERKPGDDVGAVRDTAGPKFHFYVKSKDKKKPEKEDKADGDSCCVVSEKPLVKICDGRVIFGNSVLKYFRKK